MLKYVVRRLLAGVPVVLLATMVVFFLTVQLPGDAAAVVAGPEASNEIVEQIRRDLGFDRPIHEQYGRWLGRMLTGDLGRSVRIFQRPVSDVLKERLPVSIELVVVSVVLSFTVALPVGVISALKRNSATDIIATLAAMVGISVPNFVLGFGLIFVLGVTMGWLPTHGWTPLSESLWGNMKTVLLPAIALSVRLIGAETRLLRTAMLEVLGQDYIRTAHAKGLHRRTVVIWHALRNALVPLVTFVGVQTGHLLGGSIIVEQVFGLPGMGKLTVDAIYTRDFPVIQAVVLFMVLAFLISNLLIDILYAYLDPRIRYA